MTTTLEAPTRVTQYVDEYANQRVKVGHDNRRRCGAPDCDKIAKWEHRYHPSNDGDCAVYFFCGEHNDEQIEWLVAAYTPGPIEQFEGMTGTSEVVLGPCPNCGSMFSKANSLVKVVRIP